jgi:glycosyltransferase involved in cell wall biosynthesis
MNKTKVTYFFRKPQPQYFSIEKVFEQVIAHLPDEIEPLIYKLKNGTNGWWGRLRALLEVWKNKGTINHITGDITFIALALPKKGLVLTYHDLESLAQYKGWQFKVLKLLWVTLPVKKAQVVIAISNHTKAQLLKWTNCDPNKIVVIPNPLPEEIKYSPKEFNTMNPTVLIMGTKDNKNVEGILEAVASVNSERLKVNGEGALEKGQKSKAMRQELKRIKLIVVGKMTEAQKSLAEKYKLEIENLIQVPYSQILNAYKRCDLLCFPSFYEGFGLPIIEAQAIGRPVITSDFGAMKEIAWGAASLVCPNNISEIQHAIEKLIYDEELRKGIVARGLKNVERFEANVVSDEYAKVYNK